MKRIPAVIFAFFIIILTAACSAKTAPAAVAQIRAVTITPLTLATRPPTAAVSSTAAPTDIPAPTATLTPSLPTAIPTVGYAQECIAFEEGLPTDFDADGALMMQGGRYASRWSRTVFHFDLMSVRRSPLPFSAVSLSPSPDGKWLAYIQLGYDGLGSVKDRFLRVTDADGRHLNLSYWGINWQTLLGWHDSERVLLHVPGYPGGDYILLNPFTGQKTTAADNPMPEQADRADGETILSASLDGQFYAGWVMLDPPGTGYPFPNHLVLQDAQNAQITDLCFENKAPSDIGWVDNIPPVWSPDGSYLAVAVSRIEQRANSRYTQEILIWDTAIIDLQERRGYILARDARPQAWLRKP